MVEAKTEAEKSNDATKDMDKVIKKINEVHEPWQDTSDYYDKLEHQRSLIGMKYFLIGAVSIVFMICATIVIGKLL